ncbi:MAG TPA: IS1 family transposase [Methylobacter sp.]
MRVCEPYLDITKHETGKRNTPKMERENLNLRTWIMRFTRNTSCFSKSVLMHDIVIELLINKKKLTIFMPAYRFVSLPIKLFNDLLNNRMTSQHLTARFRLPAAEVMCDPENSAVFR